MFNRFNVPASICIAALATVSTSSVIGQTAPQTMQVSRAVNFEGAQTLFDQYRRNKRGSANSESLLIEVANMRLARSKSNASSIRELLATQVNSQEKIGLIRLLAGQYEKSNPTGINHLILQDFKILSGSGDKGIARAATFAITRLGFVSGFEDVLSNGLASATISIDEYYGEIAHVVAFAPPPDQLRLAKILRQSKNPFAGEIIAMLTNSAVLPSNWSTEARAELSIMLEGVEPNFPSSLGVYDIAAAVRYSNWLQAFATTRSSVLNKDAVEFILSRLNDERTEPRKVMAFLISEYSEKFLMTINQRSRLLIALEKVAFYSKQHPQNRDMREIVETVTSKVAQLPG